MHFALTGLGVPHSSANPLPCQASAILLPCPGDTDSQDHVGSSLSSPGSCAFTPEHNGLLSVVTPEILLSTAADKRRPSVSGPEAACTPASWFE